MRRMSIGLVFPATLINRSFFMMRIVSLCFVAVLSSIAARGDQPPAFADLLATPVHLKAQLEGVHPRVFVTEEELQALRVRARTTHREEWSRVISNLAALKGDPPKLPGPQERRAQNTVAYALAEVSLAYAIEKKPEYLDAARRWTFVAIDYEPWGYPYNLPNVDLAAVPHRGPRAFSRWHKRGSLPRARTQRCSA